jgi:hypothetical protein
MIFRTFALAAFAATTLAGCSVTGGDLVRPGEPTATLIISNATGGYLDAVVISACDNFTYGLNRLTDGDSIPPGGQRQFTLSAGCWDVGGGEFGGGEAYERMVLTSGMIMTYSITD